jgi:enoyl-CoA hydratase/carnithine racemase
MNLTDRQITAARSYAAGMAQHSTETVRMMAESAERLATRYASEGKPLELIAAAWVSWQAYSRELARRG